MATYPIHISSRITENKLQQGLFIYLFRASRIPPHLGIIYKGKLFDITLNGPNLGLDVNDFLETITKKYTKTVFIELELPNDAIDIEELIHEKVLKYECVTSTVSCLNPIRDFITEAYGIDVMSTQFVFDLLPILDQNKLKKNGFHINCDRNLNNGIFQLTTYTQKDIDKCMEALNRKQVTC